MKINLAYFSFFTLFCFFSGSVYNLNSKQHESEIEIEGIFGDIREIQAELRFSNKRLDLLEVPLQDLYRKKLTGEIDATQIGP